MRSFLLVLIGILCLICSSGLAQNNSLATVGSVLYLAKDKTILESAGESNNYTTIIAAIKATDMEDLFGQQGPFTFFAPSDKAFSVLSKSELEHLFKPVNRKKLKSLLTYHVVAGDISASKILRALCRGAGKTSFTTLQGNKIKLTMMGSDIIITDGLGNSAKIVEADMNQSNGVIHQIDHVIRPRGL
ncbi:MAG: fasciclin domain-containing protein [Croceitalea sp.]|nr:fasciclin domain-containing protein [Croceitalea sp.]NNM18189.1 fasciclin domain-containing protein [Croceitalea sp.]